MNDRAKSEENNLRGGTYSNSKPIAVCIISIDNTLTEHYGEVWNLRRSADADKSMIPATIIGKKFRTYIMFLPKMFSSVCNLLDNNLSII